MADIEGRKTRQYGVEPPTPHDELVQATSEDDSDDGEDPAHGDYDDAPAANYDGDSDAPADDDAEPAEQHDGPVGDPLIVRELVLEHPQVARAREDDADRQRQEACLLYTSPSPRDGLLSRMPSSA